MKSKLSGRFWSALILFGLFGQIAWVVENMYFNVFIYKVFSASASDISLMVAASAVSATLTSVFIGALSDKIGKRKLFICGGYLLWGVSILSFAAIRVDVIDTLFPMVTSAASVGVTLVIIMDCVMTFFGSSANDAAFNAWVTDSTDSSNRGAAEGLNAMMPLVAILTVFGGFMSFNLDNPASWTTIFLIIGAVVIAVGIVGLFLIEEPPCEKSRDGYLKTVFYGFTPTAVRESRGLYSCLLAFIVFNISIQIFMPYLIIYYEVSLGMSDYVFVMAPAIVLASVVTALWGRVYDKRGYRFSGLMALAWLLSGYALLFFTRSKLPVFIGSLLMMSGYLAGMAVFGARIRDNTPAGKAGRLQGVRIFSQVFVPGLIGPFIGKTVLASADTMVGSDGTESFIPSADVFAAAAVPAAVLLVAFLLMRNKKPPRLQQLTTPYEVGDMPHDYYPRPQLKRDSFVNLNGTWQLRILRYDDTVYAGDITVPFPPESALSGVGHITRPEDCLVYTRRFDYILQNENRLLLHFGAVDNTADVFVNGTLMGHHDGGYLPFTLDITEAVTVGSNTLEVRVTDTIDGQYPYGKQRYNRGGMWYTPVSGIWQTVWLEEVPQRYIQSMKITTTLDSVTIRVDGGCDTKTLLLEQNEYTFTGDEITVLIENPRLWTPDTPELYRFTVVSGDDRVESYFALRTVTAERVGKNTRLCLNGKPYFFHGLLDQGYYPDGLYTPANAAAFADDILGMKALGFNMLRKHIKIEPDIFYYYCDLYGMAVFQDMVNNGRYRFFYDTALPTVGFKRLPRHESALVRDTFLQQAEATVDTLYNHPCIVYYTIYNEGWGQTDAGEAYARLKARDPSRIWDTASGWFGGVPSDVVSEHVYFKKADFPIPADTPAVLSEFGGYSCKISAHSFNIGQTFGYRKCDTPAVLMNDLERLYLSEVLPLVRNGLSAAVLTQVSDIEDETNGMLTYDRRVTKVDAARMLTIAEALQTAASVS